MFGRGQAGQGYMHTLARARKHGRAEPARPLCRGGPVVDHALVQPGQVSSRVRRFGSGREALCLSFAAAAGRARVLELLVRIAI